MTGIKKAVLVISALVIIGSTIIKGYLYIEKVQTEKKKEEEQKQEEIIVVVYNLVFVGRYDLELSNYLQGIVDEFNETNDNINFSYEIVDNLSELSSDKIDVLISNATTLATIEENFVGYKMGIWDIYSDEVYFLSVEKSELNNINDLYRKQIGLVSPDYNEYLTPYINLLSAGLKPHNNVFVNYYDNPSDLHTALKNGKVESIIMNESDYNALSDEVKDKISIFSRYNNEDVLLISVNKLNYSKIVTEYDKLINIEGNEEFLKLLGVKDIVDFSKSDYELIKSKWSNIYIYQ